MKLFFYIHIHNPLCTVMGLVKNTRQQVLAQVVADMNWGKKDALNVNCLLYGKDYGVLVADVYYGQNLELKNQNIEVSNNFA